MLATMFPPTKETPLLIPERALQKSRPVSEVLWRLSTIGLYTFGGTAANLALFYRLFVEDEKWIPADKYAEFLAFAQSIPGPTAVQVLTLCTSYVTKSPLAGVAVAIFFSFPAALVMGVIGLACYYSDSSSPGLVSSDGTTNPGGLGDVQTFLRPVEIVVACGAVGVVLSGALKLGEKLVTTKTHKVLYTVSVLGCIMTTVLPTLGGQLTVAVLLIGGITTSAMSLYYDYKDEEPNISCDSRIDNLTANYIAATDAEEPWATKTQGAILLSIVVIGFFLTTEEPTSDSGFVERLVPIFFKCGCLVFGGGPVVVPLLLIQLTSLKLITQTQFVSGFALQQLMPGPMFNISAFFGASLGGVPAALGAWFAIMTPGILIMFGILPYWTEAFAEDRTKKNYIREALPGLNAAAAGLLGGAFIVLWQKLIVQNVIRVGLAVALFSWQSTFGIKPMVVILFSMALGVFVAFSGQSWVITQHTLK